MACEKVYRRQHEATFSSGPADSRSLACLGGQRRPGHAATRDESKLVIALHLLPAYGRDPASGWGYVPWVIHDCSDVVYHVLYSFCVFTFAFTFAHGWGIVA